MSEPRPAGTVHVQMQFDAHGEKAHSVAAWMKDRYPHIQSDATAQPANEGLIIGMRVPEHPRDEKYETWHARLIAGLFPLDVACEIVASCFEELELNGEARLSRCILTE